MKTFKINDIVVVNKDIFRLEEQYELNERVKTPFPNPKTLEEYHAIDWSIWRRQTKLYASKGEKGKVIEVFHDRNGRKWKGGMVRHFAKVQIGDKIKTFRLTSLDKLW